MSMSKRLQIPVSPSEDELFKSAAKKEGLTTAEWARNLLKNKAQSVLEGSKLSREEALKALFALNGPVDNIDTMLEESYDSRYK